MARVNKRALTVSIDGVEYDGNLTNNRFTTADADTDSLTFADAKLGVLKDYFLAGTLVQDTGTASLWTVIFDQAGAELNVVYRPHGNSVPSPTQPHFTATVTVQPFDGDFLGGDADPSVTAYQTADFSWPCSAKPVRVTA